MVRQRQGKRRGTDWIDQLVNFTLASGTGSPITLLPGRTPEEMQGYTLIRTIMCYQIMPEAAGAVIGEQVVDIAIGTASQEAFAAGVVPDPSVEADEPQRGWVYRCRHHVRDSTGFSIQYPTFERDLRAMRKIDNGELYLVTDNFALVGTAFSIRFLGIIRSLFKQP